MRPRPRSRWSMRGGKVLQSRPVPKIAAPLDLTPRSVPFQFDQLAADLRSCRVVVDPDSRIAEIYEGNNLGGRGRPDHPDHPDRPDHPIRGRNRRVTRGALSLAGWPRAIRAGFSMCWPRLGAARRSRSA